MANHVRNILNFDCDEVKLKEILESIQNDEFGIGSIDFNKLIPMPEALNLTSGSIENDKISLYLTSVNPNNSYFSDEKLSHEQFSEVYSKMEAVIKYKEYNIMMTEEQIKNTVNGVMKWSEYEGKSFEI